MFKPFALAVALLASAPAFADVSIKYTGKDASDPVLSTTATTNYATGAMNYVDSAGTSFLAYCVEPDQPFAITSKGFKTYTASAFSGSQGTLLQGLYSSSFKSVNSGNQQAAFQLAVWEITGETSGTLDITQGSFMLTSSGGNNAVQALATHYLSAAQTYQGPALYSLTRLSNPSYQDLVIASTATLVPEPETYALFLGGLGVIGLLSRRRLSR
jgi:hypothetical protein